MRKEASLVPAIPNNSVNLDRARLNEAALAYSRLEFRPEIRIQVEAPRITGKALSRKY